MKGTGHDNVRSENAEIFNLWDVGDNALFFLGRRRRFSGGLGSKYKLRGRSKFAGIHHSDDDRLGSYELLSVRMDDEKDLAAVQMGNVPLTRVRSANRPRR